MCSMTEEFNVLKLDIGGTVFKCNFKTLQTFPESRLARLGQASENEYFFDRDPFMFACILDGYRKGSIHVSKDICGETFIQELDYWELSPRHVAHCCWRTLYGFENDMEHMDMIIEDRQENEELMKQMGRWSNVRRKIWLALENPKSSCLAFVWGVIISMVIVTYLVTLCMQTLPEFKKPFDADEKAVVQQMVNMLGFSNSSTNIQDSKPFMELIYIDIVCTSILSFEYALAFVVCPCKKWFLQCPIRLALLVGYISAFIAHVMGLYIADLTSVHIVRFYIAALYLSSLKILRLLYITKHVPAFKVLGHTFNASRKELIIFVFMLIILVCLFGLTMYIAEMTHNAKMSNLPSTLYWALITLTTVGYGDYTPVTTAGYVTATFCAVCGVLVLTMPISVIASTFYSLYTCNQYVTKHFSRYK